jgi:hypothetical protein
LSARWLSHPKKSTGLRDVVQAYALHLARALRALLDIKRAALCCKELIKCRVAVFPVVRRRPTGDARIVKVRIVELEGRTRLEGSSQRHGWHTVQPYR